MSGLGDGLAVPGQRTVFDDILDRPRVQDPRPDLGQRTVFDDILEGNQEERDQQLHQAVTVALRSDPEFVAEAQRIGLEIDVDPRQVEKDLDGYRQVMRRVQLQRWQNSLSSPTLRQQMRSPAFARLAHDDIENLGELERLGDAWKRGALQVELGQLESRRRDDGLTDEEAARAEAIGSYLRENRLPGGFFRDAAEILGQVSSMLPRALESGLETGLATGGTALIAGQLGPQAAVPEEILTVPGAAIGGLVTGTAAEFFRQSYRVEGGLLFREMIAEGIDPSTAAWVSRFGGLTAGALETVGAGLVARPAAALTAPARRALLRQVGAQTAEALARPGIGRASAEFAKGYVTGLAGEVTTEALQEVVGIVSEDVGRAIDGKPTKLTTPEGRAEAAERIGEVMAKTARGMALLALPGPSVTFVAETRRARSAEDAVAMRERRAAVIAESKVRQRSPQAFETFDHRTLAGSDIETTYVAADRFAEALEQSGKSREELASELPDVAQQLPEALATGGDILMPTARYEAMVLGTDLGTALAQHVRNDPDGYSEAELPLVQGQLEGFAERVAAGFDTLAEVAESARAIENQFRRQVQATGRLSPAQARDTAAAYRAFVETQAERLGMRPEEFAKSYPLQVVRGERVDPAGTLEQGQESVGGTPPTGEELPSSDAGTTQDDAGTTPARRQATLEERDSDGSAASDPETELRQDGGQGPARAAFDPTSGAIALFEGADVTSVLHELAHAFLHWYGELAVAANAPAQVRADLETFLEWRGIEGGAAAWNAMTLDEQRPHHEAFAESFETYAFEGEAPSLELQGVFSRFRRWIARLWQNIRGQVQAVPAEIRGVFDRMLASEESIAHAEAVRGLYPMFAEKPEAWTDAAWERYQKRADEATEAAVQEVQGRSLRDMQWLGGARSRKLRQLQRQHDERRQEIEAEVRAEVEAEPAYRALEFVRRGRLVTETGTELEVEGAHKLHTASVRELVPEGTDLRTLAITTPEGLFPDQVAEMFGYDSGAALVRDLLEAAPLEGAVAVRTDRRMVEQHADLVDADALRRAVDQALHNPARARFVATELKALTEARQPVRLMVAAAREVARTALGRMPVSQIKVWRFQAAEGRARREALRAAGSGDTAAAIAAVRTELLQHEMAREAVKVEREVSRKERQFRSFRKSDKKLAETRDLDFINAGRAMLASVRALDPVEPGSQAERQQADALEVMRAEFAAVHDEIQHVRANFGNQNYRSLPLDDFRTVAEVADSLWSLSRANRLINIEGRKLQVATVVGELEEAIEAQPARLAPGSQPPAGRTPNLPARRVQGWWHFLAGAKKFQHWARFMDQAERGGPFQRFLLDPMFRRIDEYRARRLAIQERLDARLQKLMKQYGGRWDAWIEAPDLDFRFRGVRQLADVLLDIGNESNLAKRLVGEGWAPDPMTTDGVLDRTRWTRFFESNLQTEENPSGVITPELMEFVSAVWDEFETLKPEAQAIHKEVLGREFEELERQPVALPWGTIAGGYAPVRVDQMRARRPRQDIESLDALQNLEQDYVYSRASVSSPNTIGTGRGFTISRNPNYFDRLTMDLGRRLQAFDAELRFIYLQPHVRNVVRITQHRDFSEAMNAYDREALRTIIHPWLESSARQTSSRRGMHPLLDWIANWLRNGTGIAFLGFKATIALVQATGVVSGSSEVGTKFWMSGIRHFLANPRQAWQEAAAKSTRMRDRLNTYSREIEQRLSRQSLSRFPRTFDAFRDRSAEWAWWPIRMVQGAVDVSTWHGAYQESLANSAADADIDAAERQAVLDANMAVERSQGASNPENLARFEADTPTMRLFFQFMSFSNTMLNQTLVRTGLRQGLVRKVGAFLWLPAMISLLETGVRSLLRDPREDDDEDYLTALAKKTAENFGRNVTGMLPMVGPSLMALATNEADRVGTAPAASAVGTAARGMLSALEGEPDARAIGVFLTLTTGIPFTIVARPFAQQQDIERGRIPEPDNLAERLTGLIVGR